jgi:hypothetical protein
MFLMEFSLKEVFSDVIGGVLVMLLAEIIFK